MHVHVLVAADMALHVVTTDAEMRLAPALLMRRASARSGLAFQRRHPAFTVLLTLTAPSVTHASASLSLAPAPADAYVQVLASGQVIAGEPLRGGEVSFRALPVRALRLRLYTPAATLGHIHLDLDAPSHAPSLPHG
jgi:hypothetical protein